MCIYTTYMHFLNIFVFERARDKEGRGEGKERNEERLAGVTNVARR